ncbi:peptidoglycan editing factor PgeF [Gilvimarinus polysaccharolyticus]|uniref:peptidoglycan editing factor PgeF n=1 Tax=Gilvimarinus polysaccharolyticus TaxID=863921 RepID=UPI0006732AF7|nr:peptidoglycan editing factor PgeF [Gilvimarinus polysaccharolyticus]
MSNLLPNHYIVPDWPAPANVRAVATTRLSGVSEGGANGDGYASFNLATHVGDNPNAVATNRQRLKTELALSAEPQWLEQVHGIKVVDAVADGLMRTADGATTTQRGLPCAVLTADCLPILLCDRAGTQVAAVHAGWRSLAAGIVPRALARFNAPPEQLMAWLGPAISAQHFEVGVDVLEAFFDTAGSVAHSDAIAAAMRPGSRPMHFYADLPQLARAALSENGVTSVYCGAAGNMGVSNDSMCTYANTRFYSYRRDGQASGRMASLVWLTDS